MNTQRNPFLPCTLIIHPLERVSSLTPAHIQLDTIHSTKIDRLGIQTEYVRASSLVASCAMRVNWYSFFSL
jgi:hypothetical protein